MNQTDPKSKTPERVDIKALSVLIRELQRLEVERDAHNAKLGACIDALGRVRDEICAVAADGCYTTSHGVVLQVTTTMSDRRFVELLHAQPIE